MPSTESPTVQERQDYITASVNVLNRHPELDDELDTELESVREYREISAALASMPRRKANT